MVHTDKNINEGDVMRPTEVLKEEHEAIKLILRILETA